MPSPSARRNPELGLLPGCISPAPFSDFLRYLPRPRAGGPTSYGQQMIGDALGQINAASPRDRW